MSFSGGVYTLPGPALQPGEIVSSTENNQFRNDVATAFNLTFLRNGTSTATANLPMGGYKLTGLGVATTSGDALSYGQAATVSTLTATGAAALNGGITVDSTAFTVADTTGNTSIAGTLAVTGATTLTGALAANGGITVDTSAFTVADTTGNTSIAGTLAVTGVTTLTANPVLNGGTANGVAYLNGSKVLTTGSALTFDGTNLGVGGSARLDGSLFTYGGTPNANNGVNLWFDTATNTGNLRAYHSGVDWRNFVYNAKNQIWQINDTEQMRLTSTGLGIGTSSPGYKLDVSGTINAQSGRIYNTSATKLDLVNTTSGLTYSLYSANSASNGFNGFGIFDGTAYRVVLDSSGILGLGVTPSAWNSDYKAIQLGANGSIAGRVGAANTLDLSSNAYRDAGGTWRYLASSGASRFVVDGLYGYQWFNAPSGTAGNAISFTQAMTLDASGNLGLGTTAVRAGVTAVSASTVLSLDRTDGNSALLELRTGGTIRGYYGAASGAMSIWYDSSAIEKMRIDSSGNVGIGTSSPSARLHLGGSSNNEIRVDTTASGYLQLGQFSNGAFIGTSSSDATAGVFRLGTGGIERMRIDSSGNLGLGVTPSAWTAGKAIDVGGSGSFYADGLNYLWSCGIAENAYKSATTWKYKATGYTAGRYEILGDSGGPLHAWYTAPSGTAGNAISFTQAMTLDASGNLLVGQTSASNSSALNVTRTSATVGATKYQLAWFSNATGYGNGFSVSSQDNLVTIGADFSGSAGGAAALAFATNSTTTAFGATERMRIDSSGQLKTQVTNGSAIIDTYGCRAWVNFDGTAAGTFAGGSSTVTRNVGTTTCTVTTTNAHGLITGNVVYNNAITGLVAGVRTVTVTNSTTFTFTSTETTSIAAASITFAFANIRAAGNVNSVADIGVGNYYINFTTAMPDSNYSVSGSAQGAAGTSISIAAAATSATPLTANSFPIEVNTDAGAALDSATVSVQVFR